MKRILIAFTLFGLVACEKTKLAEKVELSPGDDAWVKLGYFAAYSTPTNFSVQFKVDTVRSSNLFTYPIAYPGGGFNMGGQSFPDYLSLPSGQQTVKISIPKSGSPIDSVTLLSRAITLEPRVRQTLMITDTGTNIQATVLRDDVTFTDTGFVAKGKFFNGIPNAPGIDLYIRTPRGVVAAAKNVLYKAESPYFTFTAGIGADTMDIVRANEPYSSATSPTLARYIFTTPGFGRVYTILARGYILTPPSTTDLRRPQVSIIVNK